MTAWVMLSEISFFSSVSRVSKLVLVVVAGALAVGACSFQRERPLSGPDGGGGTGPGRPPIQGLSSIIVMPASTALVLDPSKPKPTQQYRAIATVFGRAQDVTDAVDWSTDRPIVATINNHGLATVGSSGGIVTITAQNNGKSGSAVLTVTYSTTFVATGANAMPALPTDPGGKFNGATNASRNPQLVYPNDHVLFPPNVFGIEIHWRPGSSSNTLYEVRFKSAIGDFKIYTRCQTLADGCLYAPPNDVWSAIAETNRGAGTVQLTVRGTDDTGSAVGTSTAFTMTFAKDDLLGALYYWTTSQGTGIMRWDFGDTTKTTAQKFIGTQFTNNVCVGCHALSRDGQKIVASSGGQNVGKVLLFDVARQQPMTAFPLAQLSQFESWSPDGSQFVGIFTDNTHTGPSNLILFDGTTGARTGQIDLGGLRADHPDWSQDGNRIAFTSVDTAGTYTDQRPGMGAIAYIDNNGVNGSGTWAAPQTLVDRTAGKNHYYPAIAPDNQVLVYNESTCTSGNYGDTCDGDMDPTAKMWVTLLPPSPANPVQLVLANSPGVADNGTTDLTNSFPKWAPFVFRLSETRKLLWLTVSSSRAYGLRPPPPSTRNGLPAGTLIWMVAIDPTNLLNNQDPSYAAFCLPFQDITTSNHIAQWTERIPPPVL
jgi:hypothetical protein